MSPWLHVIITNIVRSYTLHCLHDGMSQTQINVWLVGGAVAVIAFFLCYPVRVFGFEHFNE